MRKTRYKCGKGDELNALITVTAPVNSGVTAATGQVAFGMLEQENAGNSAMSAGRTASEERLDMKRPVKIGTVGEEAFVVAHHPTDVACDGMPPVLCTPWPV